MLFLHWLKKILFISTSQNIDSRLISEFIYYSWSCMFPRKQQKTEFQLSINSCRCQFNATRNLKFGVRWRRKLYSVQNSHSTVTQHSCENSGVVQQLNCDTARQWKQQGSKATLGPRGLGSRPLCSVLWHSASGPHWSVSLYSKEIFPCFSAARETHSSLFSRKEKCTLKDRGELAYIDRSPCLLSLIRLSSFAWELQIFTVWLV